MGPTTRWRGILALGSAILFLGMSFGAVRFFLDGRSLAAQPTVTPTQSTTPTSAPTQTFTPTRIPAPTPSATPTIQPGWAGPTSGKDIRFGGAQVSDLKEEGRRVADDLGLTWSRELFYWESLERYPINLDDLQYTGRFVDVGRQVVGLLEYTAAYANKGRGGLYPPDNLSLPWDSPDNYWGQFAYAVAQRMRGKVDFWIIWNEPDICESWMEGFAWQGTVEDYYRLLKVGYQAIKAANPQATVIFGNLGIVHQNCRFDGTETSFFNRWLEVAARDPEARANNWFFDAMSLNIHKEPERVYEMIARYRQLMRRYGFDKPIWLMETSVPLSPTPIDPSRNAGLFATKDQQLSFIIQSFANAIVAGVERIDLYKLSFYPPEDPSYNAVKTAIKYMSYVERAVKYPDIKGPDAYNYRGIVRIEMDGPGFRTTVLYNRSPQATSVAIPALSNQAWLADKYGNERLIKPEQGFYRMELEGAIALFRAPWQQDIYFIGGSPLLLREAH
ncbi:MAG: hypothetical protein HYX89_08820 [Chloroflexi bacterium]|nr:hypothetical protein [Chloroflexota bacterium]